MPPPPSRRSRAILLAAAAILGSGTGGCVADRLLVQYVRPVEVRATGEFKGEVRVLRVRGYADEDYRAGDASWAESIRAQVRRASAVLEKDFGVRLEVESVLPWCRPDRARPLDDAGEELSALDRARDVDWVVGYVAALPDDPGEREQLGIATPFGRHLVLRSMDSMRYRRAADSWDELDETERESLAADWRRHRETAVFLHEWAHTLGAVHECADKWIMSTRYDVEQSGFSPESARLVELGLAHRDRRDAGAAREWAAAYRLAASRMTGAS